MAEPPDDQSCAVCRYYMDGECHRYPPTYTQGSPISHWPDVAAVDWCGEFGKILGPPPAIPTTQGE